ncbi:hypothetical protein B9Z55_000036 [Caenorhabditis nigoni]|uniref:Uncharacterized protein n=1 Tax=Caenorhabditis nigoni TaxID=1611254 RepID=A0A2G5VRH6_9PELO|nr:hypothetical protein B9Z55_000036 [Caenorhabditis nigoni]
MGLFRKIEKLEARTLCQGEELSGMSVSGGWPLSRKSVLEKIRKIRECWAPRGCREKKINGFGVPSKQNPG